MARKEVKDVLIGERINDWAGALVDAEINHWVWETLRNR